MLRTTAALLLLGLTAWGAPPKSEPKADAKPDAKPADVAREEKEREAAAAKEKIDKFHDAYKTQDAGAREAALDHLRGVNDTRVVSALGGLLTSDVDGVRVKAANLLKDLKNPKALPALQAAVFNPVNKDKDRVLAAITDAMASFGDPALFNTFVKLIDADIAVAKEAIQGLGKLKNWAAVGPLLNEWGNLQSYSYTVQGRGGASGRSTQVDQAKKRRHDALSGPIGAALGEITGESHGGYGSWKEWWKKKKAGR